MIRRPNPFHSITSSTVTLSLTIAVLVVWACLISLLATHPLLSQQELPQTPSTTQLTAKFATPMKPQKQQLGREPVIVMSTGGGLWNTGVWSGFGEKQSRLRWAHDGFLIDKTQCPVSCLVTHDQSKIETADAVVMEVINHPKFLGERARSVPFPFPPRRSDNTPLFVSFHFEPIDTYSEYLDDPDFMSNFDLQMSPSRTADIPLTMTCPWTSADRYQTMPSLSLKDKLVVYFNEHGIARAHSDFVNNFITALGDDIDAFQIRKNRNMTPEAADPVTRLDVIGRYHFALVTEFTIEEDWVESQLSQALIAGTVPIYIGAPNILDHVPGADSFIHLTDWLSRPPKQLVTFLKSVAADPEAYQRYLAWKKKPLPEHYRKRIEECVFYAECRLCAEVTKRVASSKQRQSH